MLLVVVEEVEIKGDVVVATFLIVLKIGQAYFILYSSFGSNDATL